MDSKTISWESSDSLIKCTHLIEAYEERKRKRRKKIQYKKQLEDSEAEEGSEEDVEEENQKETNSKLINSPIPSKQEDMHKRKTPPTKRTKPQSVLFISKPNRFQYLQETIEKQLEAAKKENSTSIQNFSFKSEFDDSEENGEEELNLETNLEENSKNESNEDRENRKLMNLEESDKSEKDSFENSSVEGEE